MTEEPSELYAEGVHLEVRAGVTRFSFFLGRPIDIELGFDGEGRAHVVVARVALDNAGAQELLEELGRQLAEKGLAPLADAAKPDELS